MLLSNESCTAVTSVYNSFPDQICITRNHDIPQSRNQFCGSLMEYYDSYGFNVTDIYWLNSNIETFNGILSRTIKCLI